MTDQYGLISEDYITDPENLSGTRYTQTIVATLMVYDFIYLIPRQVRYLHRKKWSKLHVIYFSILIASWVGMIADLYTVNKTWISKSWCSIDALLHALFTWAFSSLIMKILLIERLRAIWNRNFIVALTLYFITAGMFTIYQ